MSKADPRNSEPPRIDGTVHVDDGKGRTLAVIPINTYRCFWAGRKWHMFRTRTVPGTSDMDFLSECGRWDFLHPALDDIQADVEFNPPSPHLCGACLHSKQTRGGHWPCP